MSRRLPFATASGGIRPRNPICRDSRLPCRTRPLRGNVVLVGRGTAHLLSDAEGCCHVRLVAPLEWRAARVAQLMNMSLEEATARCVREDRVRKKFDRYFFGPGAGQPSSYDLVVNTARYSIDETVALIRDLDDIHGALSAASSRQLRRAHAGANWGLANRGLLRRWPSDLSLQVLERELLEEESRELGIPVAEVGRLDEMPTGILQRFRPGGIQHRYVESLERLMHQYATRGNVLLLGRGGFVFLRDHPTAFHVRLVAPMPVRVRRMMEYRWVREDVARRLLTQSDVRRRTFCLDFLSADWVSPLEYHLTVNTGRLGLLALDAGGERRHAILGPQPIDAGRGRRSGGETNLSRVRCSRPLRHALAWPGPNSLTTS